MRSQASNVNPLPQRGSCSPRLNSTQPHSTTNSMYLFVHGSAADIGSPSHRHSSCRAHSDGTGQHERVSVLSVPRVVADDRESLVHKPQHRKTSRKQVQKLQEVFGEGREEAKDRAADRARPPPLPRASCRQAQARAVPG